MGTLGAIVARCPDCGPIPRAQWLALPRLGLMKGPGQPKIELRNCGRHTLARLIRDVPAFFLSTHVLLGRARYGGRKGRAARRRLLAEGVARLERPSRGER